MKKAESVLRNFERYKLEAVICFKSWSSQCERPIKLVTFGGILNNRDQWVEETLGYKYVALFTIAAETLLGNIWEKDFLIPVKDEDVIAPPVQRLQEV